MRVFLDTNILISAALNPAGIPFRAYAKACTGPNHAVVSTQNIAEMKRIFALKFPHRVFALDRFLSLIDEFAEIVPVPCDSCADELLIRDSADRGIFRAAVAAMVDVIVTGDKDFLEAGIVCPAILSAAEFVDLP